MRRRLSVLVALGAAGALVSATTPVGAAGSAGTCGGMVVLAGSRSAGLLSQATLVDHVEGSRSVTFNVILAQRHEDRLAATLAAVSDPAGPRYHEYLSRDQYVAEFAPSAATADAVVSWLRAQGFRIGERPANRAYVEAAGSASQAEHAFLTTLNDYLVAGRPVRAAASDLSLPVSLAGAVTGVSGLDDTSAFTRPAIARDRHETAATPTAATRTPATPTPIPPPTGFLNAPPCTPGWGEMPAAGLPRYHGYPNPLPYAPCGYKPVQMRAAYGIDQAVTGGNDGSGQTVAIVDAYVGSTLAADLTTYASTNDPTHPINPANFTIKTAPSFFDQDICSAPLWTVEQTLDVEAVHTMAPGAHIVYMGAASCLLNDMLNAVNTIVDKKLAQIVSNSWGLQGEFATAGELASFHRIFSQAGATGIGVYFASGDSADNFTTLGKFSPDLPASSPLVTAVGGTTLALHDDGSRIFATGWENGQSGLPRQAWTPPPPGMFNGGSGGGTSRLFAQPTYQRGVVPDALATANGGPAKWRVVPDAAALADPTTGFLVGQTQVFVDGTRYSQFRLGGTSLACPLFAAMMALADHHAGFHHGFANPVLYHLNGHPALIDITALPSPQAAVRKDYKVANDPNSPVVTGVRTLDWNGIETFGVPGKSFGAPRTAPISLHSAPGYDNTTGVGEPNGQVFLTGLG